MKYEGDIGAIQRRLAVTSDLQRRRLAVLEAIELHPGERIVEAGCGAGMLLPAFAAAVGAKGEVVGFDISPDQAEAAKERCAGIPTTRAEVQDARSLSFEAGRFDAAVAIQVIEYLDRPSDALRELRRVLKPGGRFVLVATNWDTMFWNTHEPELTARIDTAWREHAPYPNLPADLQPMLAKAGFRMVRQSALPIVNNAFHEDSYAFWVARLIAAFTTGRGLVSREEADRWSASLAEAEAAARFFFSVTPVLTLAVAS